MNKPGQSKLVQWDISEGVKKRANNDDILDYVSEPLKINSQRQGDAEFIKNMKYMDIAKDEAKKDEEGLTNLVRRQQIAIEDGKDMPMSLAERRARTIEMNPLSGDEQSFGGYNLVQWDMLDRSHQSLSNEEIEDTIAAPFNLAEHEKNEQKAINRETSAQIRAREAEEFRKRMYPM